MQIEKLLEEVNVEFQKVNKKFMSDIENGREDGLYVLDTKLFLNWHKQSLKQFIDGLIEWEESEVRHPLETVEHLKEIRNNL